ncbi:MAG: amino acid adenylation domain-containing protein [Myxacorys chilensis ATA2-1-KO14]|jgi:amino acid adenylation domain-containing protein/non-ribosomal peptide synthase protein (TIGR01720 family)|nr:amino acid adenylation domain-containing protein [Myxacorys chilensis ATA2-1-KO14]
MSSFKFSAQKRALLDVLLREQGMKAPTQGIPAQPASDTAPLSFAQQRLWFLDQFEPEKPFYNLSAAVRLQGHLNVGVLEQSFNAIVQRHEALRTTFKQVNGQPVQAIAKSRSETNTPANSAFSIPLSLIDLPELPVAAREAEVQQLALEEAQQPFDLERGPLLRTTLLQLGATESVLLLTMHHIVADDWSIGVLIRELAAFYQAFSIGQPPNLPDLPIQYADFAVWQQQQTDMLETQLAYWKQKLQDVPPLLELPADRPRPPEQTFRGATQSLLLPKSLSEALKDLSHQENVTLFMTLLAAFKILLYRYTNQADLVVGTTIANRNRAEVEGLIGIFINTLVLRTDLSDNPSFRTLLERVRQITLEAYAHQDLPFEKLVEELQPDRSLSYNPLFQVMFQFRNALMPDLKLPGVTLSVLPIETDTTQFDLSLDVTEAADGLQVLIEYSTDLFDASTITRMLGHFQALLTEIVADPNQVVSTLPLLTATEEQQLLKWNQTHVDYCLEQCVHQQFEAQVELTPDAIAVIFQDQQLSYQELNQRANQLAHYLQTLGVGADVLVGICVDRSLDMIVGILGVLKAGGAYVPLDPAYPASRLAFMLADAQVPVLLTQQHLRDRIPATHATVLCLDTDWQRIAQELKTNPVRHSTPNHLVYVIYTSGSTGQPKGVMIEHRSLVNYTQVAVENWKLVHNDRILQFASFSFDTSAEEIFPCLTCGATLVLRTDALSGSMAEFLQACQDWNITVLDLPTAYWHELTTSLERDRLALPASVRLVIIGGEKAQCDRFALWQKHVNHSVRLLNTYGPTEATIVSTQWESNENTYSTLLIGSAIPNAQAYVLDRFLQLVPVGVPGELHIGGVGLARGYRNRPDLDREKFIANPFSSDPEARLYKTGDWVRYLPDGNLEYLGRIDDQVKIRGFRIELGEIELALNSHAMVQTAVVLLREDHPEQKRLAAYLVTESVSESSKTLDLNALRHFLKEKLPEYMVPATFVVLDALPLTANGKIDRRSLPLPDQTRPVPTTFAPLTQAEQQLVRIWSEVLGLEQVDIHENFFELGGDSILSIQIIAKANQVGLHITPKQLFQHQTIAELAAVVHANQLIQAEQGVVTGRVPLTPIQQWFFEQDFAEPHHWNQAVLLEVHETLDPSLVKRVVQHLLVHHDALRSRFTRDALGWQQRNVEPDDVIPFSYIDLSTLPLDRQLSTLETTATELQASLNFSEEPLLRVAFFNLGENRPDRLLIVIHHLAIDSVSWRILLEDFETAYQQLQRGESIQFPAKTTSYKQWAERLNQYAPSVAAELDDWLTALQHPTAQLPVDYLGGANTIATSRTFEIALSAAETQTLLHDIPKTYRTQINEVLLTALVQAVAPWTGSPTLLIDLEGHGREEIFADVDLSRTIGWFTTQFPVCLHLEETATFSQTLNAVKEQLRSLPNRGIGYGILHYLSRDRQIVEQLQALPTADISFNYLGQFDQGLSEGRLFRLSQASSGLAFSPRGHRSHLLEINSFVSGEQLHFNWTYSEALHQHSTVEGLAQRFIEALRSLIAHNPSENTINYTPSDFSDFQWSQWSQTDLNDILTAIGDA